MVAGAASSFPVPFVTAMTTENSVVCTGQSSESMKAVVVGVHNGNGIAAAGRSCVRDDLRDFFLADRDRGFMPQSQVHWIRPPAR